MLKHLGDALAVVSMLDARAPNFTLGMQRCGTGFDKSSFSRVLVF